jgi:hypothetical protein
MKIYFAKGIRFVDSKIEATQGKLADLFDADVTGLE